MPATKLRLCRSLLFLPASNPRATAKARELPADMIVLDCEDAVREEDKGSARLAAVAAAAEGFGERLCAIRINAISGPHYGPDAVAVRASRADFVILPKAESYDQTKDTGNLIQKPVLAMIETAAGVLQAAQIAPATAGLIAGTNDLAADLAIPTAETRIALHHSLQAIVLAARAARVAAFDGVYNRLEDDEGLARQCEEGRAFGFDGKSLIHPNQIEIANRVFGPSQSEVEAAERLIAVATGGAERFEGRMIEAMHVEQARAVLAKARR
ncbi:MAG TPA: CoA ester lyase [Allosphingosinicella sp.]|nr:CoA ester lyase [Allosphingosinicella sp.]